MYTVAILVRNMIVKITNPFCSKFIEVNTIVTRGVPHTMYHALAWVDILLDEWMAWGPDTATPWPKGACRLLVEPMLQVTNRK